MADTSVMRDGLLPPEVTDALAGACSETGMVAAGARLIRVHSNTVLYLPASNAVARINAGIDGARRVAASLTATGWLARQGFATVRPKVGRVVVSAGLVVSFWEYEETVKASPSPAALAGLLRELHSLPDAPQGLSPMPSPLQGVARAVGDHPGAFDGDDRSWLSGEIAECERRWERMRFALPAGLVHGDAHPNNLLHARRGVLLADWDHVGYGPREWDLVQAAYFRRRFPVQGDDPDAAARAYGWDLRAWPGAADLIGIREVSGLGSYIRTAAAKPSARAELAYRIKTLRERDTAAPWNSPSRSLSPSGNSRLARGRSGPVSAVPAEARHRQSRSSCVSGPVRMCDYARRLALAAVRELVVPVVGYLSHVRETQTVFDVTGRRPRSTSA